jgi:hypothetical protein
MRLLALSFLAMFADGYDLAVMGFAAPQLARAWQLPAAGFAPVLTASFSDCLPVKGTEPVTPTRELLCRCEGAPESTVA